MGRAGILLGGLSLLDRCEDPPPAAPVALSFTPLTPRQSDELELVDGLRARLLIGEGEPINRAGDRFGKNNDFTAFLPGPGPDRGLLWVNHEMPLPLVMPDTDRLLWKPRSREEALLMQEYVGGSLLALRRREGGWQVDRSDRRNRRFDARSEIPIVSEEPLRGGQTAIGTLGNCAGGITPWGTFLSCEENHRDYYGERDFETDRVVVREHKNYGWHTFFDYPPEHYGWVVEIDPQSGRARKQTALGRFHHECATVREGRDGRVAVYSGDDIVGGCIYKFIADRPGSLEKGKLYAANLEAGRWEPLTTDNPRLKRYKSQLDILVQARWAAQDAGATPLDRPEDIEIDPRSGAVFASLTNNAKRGNFYGSILKIMERDGDPLALAFESETFLTGGEDSGFACPDNLAFDPRGNLWLASDISERATHRYPYAAFGNNGLFLIPLAGPDAGRVFQVGSAPNDAELTGLTFTPDGKSLFLSVQHPGIGSKTTRDLTSHWPDGPGKLPRSAVVEITGPLLDRLAAI